MMLQYTYDLGHAQSRREVHLCTFDKQNWQNIDVAHEVNFKKSQYDDLMEKKFAETIKDTVKAKDKVTFKILIQQANQDRHSIIWEPEVKFEFTFYTQIK